MAAVYQSPDLPTLVPLRAPVASVLPALFEQHYASETGAATGWADEIHRELWEPGVDAGGAESEAFAQSVLGLMGIQARRSQATRANRIPPVIWLTLYFTAVVAMVVVGYQAGLTQSRSPFATFSLALAFSAVMMLIVDLDRPLQSFFEMDVGVMRELAEFMRMSL